MILGRVRFVDLGLLADLALDLAVHLEYTAAQSSAFSGVGCCRPPR